MTRKEENIVNISMKASAMILSGEIVPDEIDGHMGLTETIISLAERFEREIAAGFDYNAEVVPGQACRDYWEDIDAFAERELLDRYCQAESKAVGEHNIVNAEAEVFAANQENNIPSIYLEARLGINMKVTPAEFDILRGEDYEASENLFLKLVASERCNLGGDTYFPGPWNEKYLEDDLEFELPNRPLHSTPHPSLMDRIKDAQSRTDEHQKGSTYQPER